MGILPHLDSVCLANRDDENFVTHINKQFKDHASYEICGPRSHLKVFMGVTWMYTVLDAWMHD